MALIQWSNTYEPADVAGTYQLESDASDPSENDQITLRSDGTFSSTSASVLKKHCLTGKFRVENFPDAQHLVGFLCAENGHTGEFDHTDKGDYLAFNGWSKQPSIRYKRVSEQ